MTRRTFAIGDIHGDIGALVDLMGRLPELTASDTLVFLGDYVDRGPNSAEVVSYVRELPSKTPAKVVTLRGNHEDGWLRVVDRGWPEFILPAANGCRATLRSFVGEPPVGEDDTLAETELRQLFTGSFLPEDVVAWMRELPYFYEDEFAIYVHAGLPKGPEGFQHPSEVKVKLALLWLRDKEFFKSYEGKLVVFGHTATKYLPPELSSYTPEDPEDIWAGPCAIGIDTRCGKGGYLTAIELPALRIYESQRPAEDPAPPAPE
jgi:serine/threonine protein phosphatase 1